MSFRLELDAEQSPVFAQLVSSLQVTKTADQFAPIVSVEAGILEQLMWNIYKENHYFENIDEYGNNTFFLSLTLKELNDLTVFFINIVAVDEAIEKLSQLVRISEEELKEIYDQFLSQVP